MISKTRLQPIKKSNIYEQVIEHIKAYIVGNKLRPGDRLPTEAMLADELQVSRIAVREALKVLESLGVVQSRTRDGTRLRALTLKPATDHLRFMLDVEGVPMQEIAAARSVLERAMMPLIVAGAGEADFERIEHSIAAMEQAIAGANVKGIIEADAQFHGALLGATRNRAVDGFGTMLQEFFEHLGRNLTSEVGDSQVSLREHRAIYQALRAGDAETASQVMRQHLSVYNPLGCEEVSKRPIDGSEMIPPPFALQS